MVTSHVRLALGVSAALLAASCKTAEPATSPATGAPTASASVATATTPSAPSGAPSGAPTRQTVGHFVALEQGTRQSPIAIFSRTAHPTRGHSIVLDYGTSEERVVNKGHTIEVAYDAGSSIDFDGHTYVFRQFHFHTPSEHIVDGEQFPMEMHMVHQWPDDPSHYLVLAVLFREGEADSFLDEFMDAIPREPGKKIESKKAVDICDVFGPRDHYFVYQGSLTTPPYTEHVSWLVRAVPRLASAEQLATFHALEGDNARHVQPAAGRPVEYQ